MEKLSPSAIEEMSAAEWVEFLEERYFRWKYTAANRYATSTVAFRRQLDREGVDRLNRIRTQILNPSSLHLGDRLRTVMEVKGLGPAGASGLLALLFPETFGTVDQFVVKALLQVEELAEREVLLAMNPESLSVSDAVLLTCGDESRLFWPAESREATLAARVNTTGQLGVVPDDDGHRWIPVRARAGELWHIARLRTSDGRLEVGPAVVDDPSFPEYGWSVARTTEGVVALNVGTGRLATAELRGVTEVRGLHLDLGEGRWVVLGPAQGRWFETRVQPYLVTATGCSLEASDGQTRLENGPWRLRCPAP